MCSSAILSRSPVVTPSFTEERSSSRVSPTRSPATRILAIWSGVLISTPRSRKPIASHSALVDVLEGLEDPLGDLVDLTHAVDLDEQAAVTVDLDQRLGLLEVELLTAADDVLGVVGATVGLGTREQALDELLAVDGEHDHGVEGVTSVLDHPVELLHLRERARVAVEQEPRLGVGLVDAVAHHQVGDLVGDVLAGVHVLLGLAAELGALGAGGAEDVTGRDRRNAGVVGDDRGLGALAGPRGAHQDDSHVRGPCGIGVLVSAASRALFDRWGLGWFNGGILRSCAAGAGFR